MTPPKASRLLRYAPPAPHGQQTKGPAREPRAKKLRSRTPGKLRHHEAPLFEDPPTPMNHPPSPPPRSHRRKRAARCRRHSGNNTFAVRDHHPFEGLLFPEGATARAAAERRTRYPRLIVARSLIIFISFAVTLSLIREITGRHRLLHRTNSLGSVACGA